MINRRATTPRGGGIHRATVNNFGERQYKIYRKNITSDRQPMHASLRLLKLTALNKSNDDDNEDDWVKVRNDTDKVTRSMHEDIGFVEERWFSPSRNESAFATLSFCCCCLFCFCNCCCFLLLHINAMLQCFRIRKLINLFNECSSALRFSCIRRASSPL